MRLIDADVLLEELKKTGRYFQAKFDIENAPTVEERPEGEWIYKEYSYYCSNCNKAALESEEYPYLSTYCPFCGATMIIKED